MAVNYGRKMFHNTGLMTQNDGRQDDVTLGKISFKKYIINRLKIRQQIEAKCKSTLVLNALLNKLDLLAQW